MPSHAIPGVAQVSREITEPKEDVVLQVDSRGSKCVSIMAVEKRAGGFNLDTKMKIIINSQ